MRLSLLLIALFLVACNAAHLPNSGAKMEVMVSITQEGDSSYAIQWEDTLGMKAGFSVIERPEELWCTITSLDAHDTFGYYHGISTPTNYTYFQTRDTLVRLNFIRTSNTWSKVVHNHPGPYFPPNYRPLHYAPVRMNILSNDRETQAFELVAVE